MAPTSRRLAAGVLCLGLSVGCSWSSRSGPEARDAAARVGADAAATETAELRAGLTFLLTEHVFDLASATRALVRAKADLKDRDVIEDSKALDANSLALAAVVTRYATTTSHDRFLAAWRVRAGLLMQYAGAVAVGDDGEAVRLRVALEQSAGDLGADVHAFVLPLPAQTIQDDLRQQTTSFMTALDTYAAHGAGSAAQLAHSASLMLPVAGALATGIAAGSSLH